MATHFLWFQIGVIILTRSFGPTPPFARRTSLGITTPPRLHGTPTPRPCTNACGRATRRAIPPTPTSTRTVVATCHTPISQQHNKHPRFESPACFDCCAWHPSCCSRTARRRSSPRAPTRPSTRSQRLCLAQKLSPLVSRPTPFWPCLTQPLASARDLARVAPHLHHPDLDLVARTPFGSWHNAQSSTHTRVGVGARCESVRWVVTPKGNFVVVQLLVGLLLSHLRSPLLAQQCSFRLSTD